MLRFLIVLFLPLSIFAQSGLQIDNSKLDYGTIKEGDDRILELQLTNYTSDVVHILRVQVPSAEYSIKFSSKEIPAGEKALVRIKYNPKSKGRFSDILTLFTSEETFTLKSIGKTDYLEWADYTPCPDFNKASGDRTTDFDVLIKVVDRDSREPIARAEVVLKGKTKGEYTFTANNKGEVVCKVPIDYYDLSAKKSGYGRYNMDSYINRRNRNFTLELMKGESSTTIVVRPDTKKEEKEELVQVETETVPEVEVVVGGVPEPVIENSEFSETDFKPNNVVFLIDVSTSMRKEDRLEILKGSMIELTKMLRPLDVLSIITYASSTDVVISGEPVSDKQRIIEVIENLEGKGLTAGEAGIKKAYALASRHWIEGGNNQLYVATDGAFNKGGDKIQKVVRKQARKGTMLSVLAIRGSKWSKDKMEGLARAGKGTYLQIEDAETAAEGLKEMVKSQAARD